MSDHVRTGLIGAVVATLGAGVIWWGLGWWRDYGACLASHQEPRHRDGYVEMRSRSCGKECHTTVMVYHPAEDWIETVCDRWQYPEGDGPSAGRYIRRDER